MFKTNSYFNGKVVSIAFEGSDGPATIGVMKPGQYEFSTSKIEYMKVVSGEMLVKLPGENEFKPFKRDELFIVPAGCSFEVKLAEEVSYLCLYK